MSRVRKIQINACYKVRCWLAQLVSPPQGRLLTTAATWTPVQETRLPHPAPSPSETYCAASPPHTLRGPTLSRSGPLLKESVQPTIQQRTGRQDRILAVTAPAAAVPRLPPPAPGRTASLGLRTWARPPAAIKLACGGIPRTPPSRSPSAHFGPALLVKGFRMMDVSPTHTRAVAARCVQQSIGPALNP